MINTLSSHEPLPLESRSLLVVHATVTGTAVDVAERIARRGFRSGWQVTVKDVKQFDKTELLEQGLIVFVLPTTGNGVVPPSFAPLWTSLLHPALPNDFLEDLRYAVFALGDSSYAKYNWAGKKLSRRLDHLGATAIVERGEADDQNEWGVESTFPQWLERFYAAVDPLYPAPQSFTPLPPTQVPPSRIKMTPIHDLGATDEAFEPLLWDTDARWAKITAVERTTAKDWFQDVRKIEIAFENSAEDDDEAARYTAGDVLEIRPQNSAEDVEQFLSSAGWDKVADVPFRVEPRNPNCPLASHLPNPLCTTLRYLLTHELDIIGVPRHSFFEWLSYFSEGDMEEKLRFFCSGEGQDDLIDYTLRPRRTITEVMYEFRAARVPFEYVFDLLPPMRSRGFSIASSPGDHCDRVELLVAIVDYRTILSTPRKGVCTSYLSRLAVGARIPVRFDRSGLLRSPPRDKPLIMIGPGTGCAPFRALMEERKRDGARDNLLFFGCRSLNKDFHFESDFKRLQEEGWLTLVAAGSRDQEHKIYVQHLIPSCSALIWNWLSDARGGRIYICGTSSNMPKGVKKAFLEVYTSQSQSKHNAEALDQAGEKWWDEMEKQGRIIEETWG